MEPSKPNPKLKQLLQLFIRFKDDIRKCVVPKRDGKSIQGVLDHVYECPKNRFCTTAEAFIFVPKDMDL